MTLKRKTLKIPADVHQRLTGYKVRLQAQRNAFTTFGDAITAALDAADALVSLKGGINTTPNHESPTLTTEETK